MTNNFRDVVLQSIFPDKLVLLAHNNVHVALLSAYLSLRITIAIVQLFVGLLWLDSGALLSACHITFMTSALILILLAIILLMQSSPKDFNATYTSSPYALTRLPLLLIFTASSSLLFVAFFHIMEGLHVLTAPSEHVHDTVHPLGSSFISFVTLLVDLFVLLKLHHVRSPTIFFKPRTSAALPHNASSPLILLCSPWPLPLPEAADTVQPLLHLALLAARAFALVSLFPSAEALSQPLQLVFTPGVAAYIALLIIAWLLFASLAHATVLCARVLMQGAPHTATNVVASVPSHDEVCVWSADGVSVCVDAQLGLPVYRSKEDVAACIQTSLLGELVLR